MHDSNSNSTSLTDNLSELAILAHDINDPLSYALVSLNSLNLIAQEFEDTPKEVREKYNAVSAIVKNNIYRAIRISNNILDADAFLRDDTKIYISPCNVSELLKSNLHAIKEILRLKNANAHLILNVSEPFIACVDEMALERVILNLITNSINHLPSVNGSIIITLSSRGKDFEIEVKDNGIGIKPEIMPYIFNKFYKDTSIGSLTKNMAGLGLFIAKSLITLHGGTIKANSTPHEQTVFTITLPWQTDETRVVTLKSETEIPFDEKYDILLKHELSTID